MFDRSTNLKSFPTEKSRRKMPPLISGGFMTQKTATKFATTCYPADMKTAANALFWPFLKRFRPFLAAANARNSCSVNTEKVI
jgi:hypothetical protein